MRGVVAAYVVYQRGVYRVVVECADVESMALVKKKLRLVGIFITAEKGKGLA